MTYLNTAAEGIPPRAVGAALEEYFKHKQGGNATRPKLFAMRETLKKTTAAMYGLSADEIGICSCSAEAYNLAATALRLKDGDEVVVTDLEFPSSATPWLLPANRAATKIWRNVDGALRIEDLIPLLGSRTRLVSVSAVSFLNGHMICIPRVVEAVQKHSGALLAVDVTQALGRVPLDLRGVDLIVSSTHKWILGSHGGGLVGIPKCSADRLHVQAGGWFNINDAFGPCRFDGADAMPGAAGFSVGMPNFPAIFAVAAALEYIRDVGVENIDKAARPLVLHCVDELAKLPVELITPREPDALAGIIAFKHPSFEAIERRLRADNIHIMAHTGRLRISLHGYNTAADVERFLRKLKEALNHVGSC